MDPEKSRISWLLEQDGVKSKAGTLLALGLVLLIVVAVGVLTLVGIGIYKNQVTISELIALLGTTFVGSTGLLWGYARDRESKAARAVTERAPDDATDT